MLVYVFSRESLAFATEPVLCSLANVLGQHENLPQQALAALKDYTFFDVEIKYGLLQVCHCLNVLNTLQCPLMLVICH